MPKLTNTEFLKNLLELMDECEPTTPEERRAFLIERGYDPDRYIEETRAQIKRMLFDTQHANTTWCDNCQDYFVMEVERRDGDLFTTCPNCHTTFVD